LGRRAGATKAQLNEETADRLAFFLFSFRRNSPSAAEK
jgi:hypothetical protein